MEERIGETIERMLERNARVEADKAWESSYVRIGSIALVTYLGTALVLYSIGVDQFYLSAVVPVVGYLLSTQTLPSMKEWWLKYHYKK